jgi:hypothetical protein
MSTPRTDELMFPPQHIVRLHMHMKADENVSFPVDSLYLIYPATITRRKTCVLLGMKSSKSKRSVVVWVEYHTLPYRPYSLRM